MLLVLFTCSPTQSYLKPNQNWCSTLPWCRQLEVGPWQQPSQPAVSVTDTWCHLIRQCTEIQLKIIGLDSGVMLELSCQLLSAGCTGGPAFLLLFLLHACSNCYGPLLQLCLCFACFSPLLPFQKCTTFVLLLHASPELQHHMQNWEQEHHLGQVPSLISGKS